jgi:transposase
LLFVGDDWAEDHHDVELQDLAGRRLARARLPEGVVGIARLHELIAAQLGADDGPEQVVVAIETDRGPWVRALLAAGSQVSPVNPRQVARYRERHATSGAKSGAGDAHTLADMVRTDRHQLRVAAGDSDRAEAVKLLARAHQTLTWDRHRHLLRLRAALQGFFPAALKAFPDLAAADALALLAAAPDPSSAAGVPAPGSWPRSRVPAVVACRPRPPRSSRRCGPSSCPNPRRWSPPTRPPCAPRSR